MTHYKNDALGNPLIYYDGTSFAWQGRRLVGAVKGTNTMSFTYDDNGLRTSKTVNGITTEYYWNGNLLVAEKTPTYLVIYNYDASGRPIGMAYHGSDYTQYQWDVYWFDLNVFGDVVAVYDNSGTQLLTYTYDPWGYCEVGYVNGGEFSQAKRNRIAYRGYYYDSDLDLYYLQSRYYDPSTKRFINADGYISTGQGILGYNMFAYCGNNPVNRVDETGERSDGILTQIFASTTAYATVLFLSVFSKEIREDMKSIGWNPFNSDAEAVAGSKCVSFYNGAAVIRTNGDSASFGIILLSRNKIDGENGFTWEPQDILKHEYGHIVQQSCVGTPHYLVSIGIPSAVVDNGDNTPWEITADLLGGVTRPYNKDDITRGVNYMVLESFVGPFWWW